MHLSWQRVLSWKSIENAERTYEINLEKYRNGNLTGMDLQQFQNQLTTAKQDYTSAIMRKIFDKDRTDV